MQRDRLLQNKIHQAFRRSEHQLLKALEARKAEVKVPDNFDTISILALVLGTMILCKKSRSMSEACPEIWTTRFIVIFSRRDARMRFQFQLETTNFSPSSAVLG